METVSEWNIKAKHPLQSYEWGEFRKQTGVKVERAGGLQITIHKIQHTPLSVGYCPKTGMLGKEEVAILNKVAKENNCIFIKCEPKVEVHEYPKVENDLEKLGFVSGRSLFTKYNFVLDVTPSEAELLASFKQKTRYNIKVAEKKGVTVAIDDSPEAFEKYLELTEETTKRQGFYAHSRDYHKKMWNTLHPAGIAHLLTAKYPTSPTATQGHSEDEIITTWILFKFNV